MGAVDRWLGRERFDAVREHEEILAELARRNAEPEEPVRAPPTRTGARTLPRRTAAEGASAPRTQV